MEGHDVLLPRLIARLKEISSPRRLLDGWKSSSSDALFSGSPYAYVAYQTAERLSTAQFKFDHRREFRRQFQHLNSRSARCQRRVIREWGEALEAEPEIASKVQRWLRVGETDSPDKAAITRGLRSRSAHQSPETYQEVPEHKSPRGLRHRVGPEASEESRTKSAQEAREGPPTRSNKEREDDQTAGQPGRTKRLIEESVFNEDTGDDSSVKETVVARGATPPLAISATIYLRPDPDNPKAVTAIPTTLNDPEPIDMTHIPLIASPIYIEHENRTGTRLIRGVSFSETQKLLPDALFKAIYKEPLCGEIDTQVLGVDMAFFGPDRPVEKCRIYLRIEKDEVASITKLLFDVDIEERDQYRYIRLPHTRARVVCVPEMLLIDPPRNKLALVFGDEISNAILKSPIAERENSKSQAEVTESVGMRIPPSMEEPAEFVLSIGYNEGWHIRRKLFGWVP